MSTLLGGWLASVSSSSSTRVLQGKSSSPSPQSYSLEGLRKLHESLSQFRTNTFEQKGASEALVETVREITEALVWGEKNDPSLFDFFCEKSILVDFIRVLGMKQVPREVNVQLLQTLSMLMQNLRRPTSVYYMLSNNRVNNLITTSLDLSDEEVLAYYVALLKSLAVRLDGETIKFYFLAAPSTSKGGSAGALSDTGSGVPGSGCSFPLYSEATKLIGHSDTMVNTTVQAITLQIYRLKSEDPSMHAYLLWHGKNGYFLSLAQHLQQGWEKLQVAVAQSDFGALDRIYESQQDFLTFLADVFELGASDFNEALAEDLLQVAIKPTLLPPLLRQNQAKAVEHAETGAAAGMSGKVTGEQEALSLKTSLLLTCQVIDIVKTPLVVGPLGQALFRTNDGSEGAPHSGGTKDASESASGEFEALYSFLNRADADEAVVVLAAGLLHAYLGQDGSSGSFLSDLSAHRAMAAKGIADALQRLDGQLQCRTVRTLSHYILGISSSLEELDEASLAEVMRLLEALMKTKATSLRASLLRREKEEPMMDKLLLELPDLWRQCHMACAPLPSPEVTGTCLRQQWLRRVSDFEDQRALVSRFGEVGVALHDLVIIRGLLSSLSCRQQQRLPDEPSLERPAAGEAEADGKELDKMPEADETPSLQLPGELNCAEDVMEGRLMDLEHVRKIVCGVSAPNGKSTRYFLCHDYWMLLVQPSLTAVGKAVVTTQWPLRMVDADVRDNAEPSRTLNLELRSLSDGLLQRGSPATTATSLTLTFEDSRQCDAARDHIQAQHRELCLELHRHALTAFLGCPSSVARDTMP